MSSSIQVSNRNPLVFDHNQALNEQNANNDRIFFAECHWDTTETDLLYLFDSFGVYLSFKVELGNFVDRSQNFLNLSFADHKCTGHHVGK